MTSPRKSHEKIGPDGERISPGGSIYDKDGVLISAPPCAEPEVLHERLTKVENGVNEQKNKLDEIRLNGAWVMMLKAEIAAFLPLLLVWGVWVTTNVFSFKGFMDAGPRFTLTNAEALELRVNANTERAIATAVAPMKLALERIDQFGPTKVQYLYGDVDTLKRQMDESRTDRAKLNTMLVNLLDNQREFKAMLEQHVNRMQTP